MSSANSASPTMDDDYFNDLSRDISNGTHNSSVSPPGNGQATEGGDAVPRPKRIACVVCRKRKLRCDGNKPSCGTCSRLQHDCAYDEVRRKSGPKRGYVKQLEARLAQVETLLKTQDPNDPNAETDPSIMYSKSTRSGLQTQPEFDAIDPETNFSLGGMNPTGDLYDTQQLFDGTSRQTLEPLPLNGGLGGTEPMTWEMIGLGIDEPLPTQDVIDELYQIYFEKIHPSVPMIHRRRFLAAMNLAPHLRPPVSLRYAMWCMAASVTDKYLELQHHFYQRARKYAEADEMKGHGEHMISIAQSQCWTLIATYEFKLMYFPRAWMSTGRGIRLAQMMGLHRLDGVGLDVKQCIPPPRDWTEREERRRTFWMAFCSDRYASIGTGWPVVIEEKDILTNLPAPDEAFDNSKPQRTLTLKQAMTPSGANSLSAFAGVVLMASLFGHNLIHLHRPDPNDKDDDLNGEFWRRHRSMDSILSNTSLSLPSHLRLPAGMNNANIVFLNMNIHTSTICLHQAAIFKADKNRLPASVSSESKVRCITAAAEIASIMRTISHTDLCTMNPFISFCLYVAARVFVQYMKSRPEDVQVRASLQFLLQAMHALKKKNPLTESFLVQLEVDLEGTGMDDPNNTKKFAFSLKKGVAELPAEGHGVECSPIIHIQQTQTTASLYNTHDPDPSMTRDGSDTSGYQQQQASATSWSSPENILNLPSRHKAATSPGKTNTSHLCASTMGGVGIVIGQGNNMDPGRSLYPNSNCSNQASSDSNNEMDLTPDTSLTGNSSNHSETNRPSPSTLSSTSNSKNGAQSTTYTPPSYTDDPHQLNASDGNNPLYLPHQNQPPTQDYSSNLNPHYVPSINDKDPLAGSSADIASGFMQAQQQGGWDLGSGMAVGGVSGDMFTQMLELGGGLGSWGDSGIDMNVSAGGDMAMNGGGEGLGGHTSDGVS